MEDIANRKKTLSKKAAIDTWEAEAGRWVGVEGQSRTQSETLL